jgi:ubiquinone/menaquinone biosynthesis C-methylase UbiE
MMKPDVRHLERERVRRKLASDLFGAARTPLLIGRFEIKERLGQGSFGVAYAAFDPTLKRDVGIKVLSGDRDPEAALTEARALAGMSHPNILQVFETGTHDGLPFIVGLRLLGRHAAIRKPRTGLTAPARVRTCAASSAFAAALEPRSLHGHALAVIARLHFLIALPLVACTAPAADSPAEEPHHHDGHSTVHHDFSDAAQWAKRFDDPGRDAWQKPAHVAELLALAPGMTAVDLGAGTGYFGRYLSEPVGASGKLLTLDVEPNMITYMKERFAKEGLANAEPRVCPTDSTGLSTASADRILIVDTWHHIEHRGEYAKHLAGVLRPGGFVLIVDFTQETEKGPPRQHRIRAEQVIEELEAGGLDATLVDETLPDQYAVKGSKKPGP